MKATERRRDYVALSPETPLEVKIEAMSDTVWFGPGVPLNFTKKAMKWRVVASATPESPMKITREMPETTLTFTTAAMTWRPPPTTASGASSQASYPGLHPEVARRLQKRVSGSSRSGGEGLSGASAGMNLNKMQKRWQDLGSNDRAGHLVLVFQR